MVVHRKTSPGELPVRKLTGRGMPGGKGLVDTLLAQQDLASASCRWAKENGFEGKVLQKLELWKDAGAHRFRIDMEQQDDFNLTKVDASWVSTTKPSGQLLIKMYEDAVIANLYKDQLMQAKLPGSSVDQLLTKTPISDRLDVILIEHLAETGGKPNVEPSSRSGPVNIKDIEEPVQLYPVTWHYLHTFLLRVSVRFSIDNFSIVEGQTRQ